MVLCYLDTEIALPKQGLQISFEVGLFQAVERNLICDHDCSEGWDSPLKAYLGGRSR